ncbi:MAG TPA: hypothetical protein VJR89_09440, partial [Polyangiales bacterium]|nr:hypothetical protein [Polyangiales bacterium]
RDELLRAFRQALGAAGELDERGCCARQRHAVELGMRAWLEANPRGRFGKHRYDLEQWGFTRRDLEPYFSDYLHVHRAVS